MSDLKQAALDLADEGFYIFPCKPGTKEPAIEGYRTARWTADQIEQWWARHPDDNIALCPDVNELVVLDLDLYKPECDWDRDVPETMMVRSASGGQHHYFEAGDHAFPGKFNGYSGVDIKHKGLVVLPPSRFANGAYEWGNDLPPAELPDWFPTRASVKVDPQAAALMSSGRGSDEGKLIELVHNSENQIEDREAWLAIGHALHFEYVGTEHEAEARWAWLDWSRRWDVPEADEADLEAAALKVWESAQTPEEVIASGRRPARGGTIRHHLRPKPPEAPEPPAGPMAPYVPIDPTKIPPRPWVLGDYLIRRELTQVVAPGGSGKSSLVLGWALSLVLNKPLVKAEPHRAFNVMFWSGEDDRAEVDRRIAAALMRHEVDLSAAPGQLRVETMEDRALKVARTEDGRAVRNEEVIEALVSHLIESKTDVLIADPLVKMHNVNENQNTDMNLVAEAFVEIARRANVAMCVVHHVGKGSLSEGRDIADAGRGASAVRDAARKVVVLRPVPAQEVNGQPNVVEILDAKANLTAKRPTSERDAFETVGVRLGNATEDYPKGDEMAVAINYKTEEMQMMNLLVFTAVMDAMREEEMKPVTDRMVRVSNRSPQWLGYLMAQAAEADIGAASSTQTQRTAQQNAQRARMVDLINEMVVAKIITQGSVSDPQQRKTRDVYELSASSYARLKQLEARVKEGL